MKLDETFESDSIDNHWLKVGTRLPSGLGPMPSSGEVLKPLIDAGRARVVDILSRLQIVEDSNIATIDG
jgi:hypothetical protein